jgi:hypothetical protein
MLFTRLQVQASKLFGVQEPQTQPSMTIERKEDESVILGALIFLVVAVIAGVLGFVGLAAAARHRKNPVLHLPHHLSRPPDLRPSRPKTPKIVTPVVALVRKQNIATAQTYLRGLMPVRCGFCQEDCVTKCLLMICVCLGGMVLPAGCTGTASAPPQPQPQVVQPVQPPQEPDAAAEPNEARPVEPNVPVVGERDTAKSEAIDNPQSQITTPQSPVPQPQRQGAQCSLPSADLTPQSPT